MALRLARWMGTTPVYWLDLQLNQDLHKAQQIMVNLVQETIVPRGDSAA